MIITTNIKNHNQIRCNNCMRYFQDDGELAPFFDEETKEYYSGCPCCKTDSYLMDMVLPNINFDCNLHTSPRTLEWCEKNCSRYSHCDTVAQANDELAELNNSEEHHA